MALSWSLELDDGKFVQGANRAASSLVVLQGSLAKTKRAFLEFEVDGGRALVNVTKLSDDLGNSMGGLAAKGLKLAADAVTYLVKKLDEFGDTAVKAFGERANTLRGYTTLLGDAAKGELEFYRAQQLSQKTDFTASTIEKGTTNLISSGFRDNDLQAARLAAADIASIAENKDQAFASTVRAMGQIKSKGKLQTEELMQLAEGAGLSIGGVKDQVAKLMKLKDRDAVDKALKGGKVSGDVGIVAIEQAIMKQLNTKKLGEFATGSSGSLTGLLSNKGEAWQNLLKSFDSEALPGVKRYKEALAANTDALNVEKESGAKLNIVLQDLANQSIELKAVWEDFQTEFLEEFANGYTESLKELRGGMNEITEGFDGAHLSAKEVGVALGRMASGIVRVVHWLERMGDEMSELFGDKVEILDGQSSGAAGRDSREERRRRQRAQEEHDNQQVGVLLKSQTQLKSVTLAEKRDLEAKGLLASPAETERARNRQIAEMEYRNSAASVGEAVGSSIGTEAVKATRKATRTHSPSEDFAEIGEDWAAGLMLGMNRIGATPSSPSVSTGNGNQITVHVEGGKDPEATAAAVRDALARVLGDLARSPSG